MAHITIPDGLPGIRGLMAFRPDTAKYLNELAEILLRGDNTLSRGDRELIATYVSYLNDCFFCQNAHGAIAQHYLQRDVKFIDEVKTHFEAMALTEKLKSLLAIAGAATRGGKFVAPAHIERAKKNGASDKEIHDTVLITAFFCLCNRYVDGLATDANPDRQFYIDRGKMRAEEGYLDFDLHK
ncbi:MAG: peroxidase-related enzyme [Bacteroidota bacterium]